MLESVPMDLTPQDALARVRPIHSLADGAHFAVASLTFDGKRTHVTGWSFGVKLFSNECRARVRLEGGQRQVVFGEGNRRRDFEAAGSSEVNYPTTLEVAPLTEDEYNRHRETVHAFRRSGGANPMDDKQIKAMKAKYSHLQGKLAKAADADATETITKQIDSILAQAAEAGIDLNDLEDNGPETGNVVTMGKGKTQVKSATAQAEKVRKTLQAQTKGKTKAAKAAKPAKEKKLDSTFSCLCDCGTECNGMFAPGHDARVKGMLYKVERGEIGLDELPASVQPLIKMAGRKATAGKDDSDYRVVQSPVKFPGRDDIKLVDREGKPRDGAKSKSVAA